MSNTEKFDEQDPTNETTVSDISNCATRESFFGGFGWNLWINMDGTPTEVPYREGHRITRGRDSR